MAISARALTESETGFSGVSDLILDLANFLAAEIRAINSSATCP